jgi:hypothetical protein
MTRIRVRSESRLFYRMRAAARVATARYARWRAFLQPVLPF